jgi:hypothetical protein
VLEARCFWPRQVESGFQATMIMAEGALLNRRRSSNQEHGACDPKSTTSILR